MGSVGRLCREDFGGLSPLFFGFLEEDLLFGRGLESLLSFSFLPDSLGSSDLVLSDVFGLFLSEVRLLSLLFSFFDRFLPVEDDFDRRSSCLPLFFFSEAAKMW